jgi:hypothetical protein
MNGGWLWLLSHANPSGVGDREMLCKETHLSLRVVSLRFVRFQTKLNQCLQILLELPDINYREDPSSGSRVVSCGQTRRS